MADEDPKGHAPYAALHVNWTGSVHTNPRYALYFFRQRQYIRWDVDNERMFDGYPRDIADGWPGLMDVFPGARLSGAVHVPGWHDRIYFFFRDQDKAVAWNVDRHQIEPDLVPIQQIMPSGLTDGGHFAPAYVDRGDSQTVYAMRGDAYTRFTVRPGELPKREDDGYPRKIGDGWTGGLTIAPTCAVSVRWTRRSTSIASHKLYFFLGELYSRWDIQSHSNNYRLDIPAGWKGWPKFE